MLLIDTNIVVAAVDRGHESHAVALAALDRAIASGALLAAHSVAEAYSTLTKRAGPNPIGMTGPEARVALSAIRARLTVVGMTAEQTLAAVEDYSETGIGPRLYDYLIGKAGIVNGAAVLLTLNLRHMQSLFPELTVLSPEAFLRLPAE